MFLIKKLAVLLLFAVIFSSCNIPTTDEPAEDAIATQVAQMLTEAAVETALAPTETIMPSPTEEKIEETPTETPTPTETATTTPDMDDPVSRLGNPIFKQDFSGDTSPWDFESDQALFNTENGTLNLTARANANWHSWRVFNPSMRNGYVEATIQLTNCSGFDRFGLAVRSTSDGQQFYFPAVTCDGRWGFFRMATDVNIQQIIAYREEDRLSDLLNEPVRLGIWMDGSNFTIYINGEEVGTASDNTLTEQGYTGFLIAYANTPGFTVKIDQLQAWNLP